MIAYKNQPGYLIVYTVILVFGLMSVGLIALSVAGATHKFTKDDTYRKNASYMARACVSVVASELDDDPDFTGFSPAVTTLYDQTADNGGIASCEVDSITSGTGNKKTVQLTAYIHRYSGDPQPVEYSVQALLDALEGGGGEHLLGGILIGNGGFTSGGSGNVDTSRMSVLGRLYKSGSGNLNVDGALYVYNIGCGSSSDWPQHCTGQDPIVHSGAGRINADICAPGQPDKSYYFNDLNMSCTLPEISMPLYDKASFVSGLSGPTISASDITSEGGCWEEDNSSPWVTENHGKTFNVPAEATITGNINLSSLPELDEGECVVVFNGDAYVEGSITGSTAWEKTVEFTVADSLSENITIIMNRQFYLQDPDYFSFTANSSDNLAHVINFNSSNTSCSDSDTVPSSSVSTCLSNAEAMASATSLSHAGFRLGSTNITKDFSGMTFYAYYSMFAPNCTSGQLWIAAVAAQGFGDCSSSGDFEITVTDPTFGIPVSSGTGNYHVVDYFQRFN